MCRQSAIFLMAVLMISLPALAQTQPKSKLRVTVADLMTPAKNQRLIGREVTVWYQPVQVKTGSSAIWVGPNEDHMVLVTIPPTVHVLDRDGEPADLDEGDYVQIHALVVRSPNDYQLKKGWGVNGDDLFLAQEAGVILMADTITLMAEHD